MNNRKKYFLKKDVKFKGVYIIIVYVLFYIKFESFYENHINIEPTLQAVAYLYVFKKLCYTFIILYSFYIIELFNYFLRIVLDLESFNFYKKMKIITNIV